MTEYSIVDSDFDSRAAPRSLTAVYWHWCDLFALVGIFSSDAEADRGIAEWRQNERATSSTIGYSDSEFRRATVQVDKALLEAGISS
jgi:hypothetical protein